jgi:lysozyme family protein
MDNFPKALAFVLRDDVEGGNDDDHRDPGGRTSRGIEQREWNAYCKVCGLPESDVWKASQDYIADIYHTYYWLPYGPTLAPGIDLSFFDEHVNAGLHEAAVILQRVAKVTVDGHIGVITMAALRDVDPRDFINSYALERERVYRQMKGFSTYGHGWLHRVELCRKASLALIENQTGVTA